SGSSGRYRFAFWARTFTRRRRDLCRDGDIQYGGAGETDRGRDRRRSYRIDVRVTCARAQAPLRAPGRDGGAGRAPRVERNQFVTTSRIGASFRRPITKSSRCGPVATSSGSRKLNSKRCGRGSMQKYSRPSTRLPSINASTSCGREISSSVSFTVRVSIRIPESRFTPSVTEYTRGTE